jgi:hypothetical protein
VKVGQKQTLRAALLGALCLPILPALAQEGGGVRMFLGLDQDFEVGENLALENPAEGNSNISTTRLSFGVVSETERQTLDLLLSGALTIQDTPDTDGTETDFGTPQARLRYTLNSQNSSLSLNGFYRVDFIDNLTFEDFINQDGVLELPEDFADLSGNGERTAYGFDALLELGKTAPLGFNLSAGASGNRYSGTNDPGLFDFSRTYVGADALLRMSPVLTGLVGLGYDTYDADNAEQTYRTTTTGDVGVIYEISERASIEARIGVTQIETEEFGADSSSTGPVGSLSYAYAMPDGEITADLTASIDPETGDQRTDLLIGRSRDLPDGAIAFALGVTDPEFGSIEPIGNLSWVRELPAARLTARIDRQVSTSNQDETGLTTLVALGYDQDINDVSGFALDLTYGESDSTSSSNRTTRTGITATYRRALTEDWNLNTGVNYRVRDEDTVGRSDSPSVFLSIGRRFDFRP